MWSKLLLMTLSYLTGKVSHPDHTGPLLGIGLDKMRKASIALTLGVLHVIVFACGLALVLADFFYMSTVQKQLGLTEVSWVGGGLLLLSAIGLSIGLSKRSWGLQAQVRRRQAASRPNPADSFSPIAEGVNALIYDFIEERKSERARRAARDAAFMNGESQYKREDFSQHPPTGMA